MIDTIIIDFGGVLGTDSDIIFIEALENNGFTIEEAKEVWRLHWPSLKVGLENVDVFWKVVGEKTKVNIEEIQRIYEESGALEKAIAKMQNFANNGIRNIKKFDKCEAKDNLLHILDRYYNNFNPRNKPEILV